MREIPCTSQPIPACKDCTLPARLMCRFETRDSVHFFIIFVPLLVTAIGRVIQSGYGWWLLGWLAYALFFFIVWAEPGRIRRCQANYGVNKLWKYRPSPMSRSELIQFLIGALLLVAYPLLCEEMQPLFDN